MATVAECRGTNQNIQGGVLRLGVTELERKHFVRGNISRSSFACIGLLQLFYILEFIALP